MSEREAANVDILSLPRMLVLLLVVDSHIQRIVATEEATVTQTISYVDLSNANPARGHKEVRRSTGHIMRTPHYSK